MHSYADNRYSATVIRWLDGDTVELTVDLGQSVLVRDNYRLSRINAPETSLRGGTTPAQKAAGRALKAQLNEDYPEGTKVIVATEKAGKYGRYLIEVWVQMGEDWVLLNDWLLDEGLAEPY